MVAFHSISTILVDHFIWRNEPERGQVTRIRPFASPGPVTAAFDAVDRYATRRTVGPGFGRGG
ncbi:hypothetical protein NUM_10090 [Actinocatenispora comari]|uniref:Uncharacterized protein n=1 Tax=Actinocatenispora comari TaxID=2807577 RepID=A0A8J4A7Q5_9ACTN|nr:hypothetical protein NUM_10090 [Actinocatenispora comari]